MVILLSFHVFEIKTFRSIPNAFSHLRINWENRSITMEWTCVSKFQQSPLKVSSSVKFRIITSSRSQTEGFQFRATANSGIVFEKYYLDLSRLFPPRSHVRKNYIITFLNWNLRLSGKRMIVEDYFYHASYGKVIFTQVTLFSLLKIISSLLNTIPLITLSFQLYSRQGTRDQIVKTYLCIKSC